MTNCEAGFNGRTVILSLFVGVISGAAAVLLFAPQVRRESVEWIRNLSHDLTERVSATIGTAKESITSTVSRGMDVLDEERSVVSSAVQAGKEAFARRNAQGPSGG